MTVSSMAGDHVVIEVEGRYLSLNPLAAQIWSEMQAGRSPDAVAALLNGQSHHAPISPAQVEQAFAAITTRISAGLQQGTRRNGQWLELTLLPARVVHALARALAVAFGWRWLFAVAVVVNVAAMFGPRLLPTGPEAARSALISVLLTWAVALFHELGHAAALHRAGGRPGPIGVAMYLIFPVFFSRVSDAWRVSRPQRMLVDVGGPAFSIVAAAVLNALGLATGLPWLQHAGMLALASTFADLNPLLRFDGHWFLKDALGLTTLRRFSVRALLDFLRGLDHDPADRALRLARYGLALYFVCLSAFLLNALRGAIQVWHALGV